MNRNSASNRTLYVFMFLTMFVAAVSFATLGCAGEAASGGDPASTFEGEWTGATTGASGSNITLTLSGANRKWRYGSPRSCDIGLEEPRPVDGEGQRYGIVSTTGGFCNKCLMGKLTITAGKTAGSLAYVLTDAKGKVVDSGQLSRAAK